MLPLLMKPIGRIEFVVLEDFMFGLVPFLGEGIIIGSLNVFFIFSDSLFCHSLFFQDSHIQKDASIDSLLSLLEMILTKEVVSPRLFKQQVTDLEQ